MISMTGYLTLGLETETVLGGGSFYTSVAYLAGGVLRSSARPTLNLLLLLLHRRASV